MNQLINITNKVRCSWKLKKKDNFVFFFPFTVSRRLLLESSGHGLNCDIFEYLMMYQFDFTDIIITILYHLFQRYFCLSDVLMMAHIYNTVLFLKV